MAFEGLADKLGNAFKKLKSKGKLTESDVKEAMREVRLALLEADVNYKVVKGLYRNALPNAPWARTCWRASRPRRWSSRSSTKS